MVLITLIGEDQARIGNRFYYTGPQTECRDCKLKGVCFNLEPGHQYEVTSIRDTKHECEIYDNGVRVVEIEKIPTLATVKKKYAIEGGMITYERNDCGRLGCDNYKLCHPIGLRDGDKRTIDEIEREVECPLDEKYVLVKLS